VVRIIRICSALALLLVPTVADARRPEPSALGLYVRARIANNGNQSAQAVASYAAALTADPGNPTIAFRAYREAVEAGSFALAIRAAQALEKAGDVPPDAHILLYIATLQNRDWAAARLRLNALSEEPGLGFLAPMFGRWLEAATRTPVVLRGTKSIDRSLNAYVAENEALIALSRGDVDDAVVAIKGMWTIDPYRAGSLRLAAASQLVERRQKARALDLIVADDGAANNARRLIEKSRDLGLSVATPSEGAAFLLARVAGDLIVEGNGRSGLTIARMAEFAAPKNARIRLMVAGALASRKRHDVALALADALIGDPIYGDDAASFRIEQLEGSGRIDTALDEARTRAINSPNDQARIGDIEMRRRNFAGAAAAYQKAVDALGATSGWGLIFAAGNAYDNDGNWAAAKPLLERALVMAPEEPAILNELGYGLLTHGETVDRGLSLITKAVLLRPDDAAIIDSFGWAQLQRGAHAEAITLFERAVRLDQSQAEIGEHLGDAYWAAGRRIDARYAWTAARVQADGDALTRLDGKIAGTP
jgi:tetratricopeptide (TPR) repeat protein